MRTFGNLLAFSPELWLLAGAIVVFLIARFTPRASTTTVALITIVGAFLALATQFKQTLTILDGVFVLDGYAIVIDVVLLATAALTLLASHADILPGDGDASALPGFLLLATLGAMLAASAAEMASLFLALELLAINLYVVSVLVRRGVAPATAGLGYLVTGAASSALLLFGLALIFGLTGQVQLAAAGRGMATIGPNQPAVLLALGLLLGGLALRMGLLPVRWWTRGFESGIPLRVIIYVQSAGVVTAFAVFGRIMASTFSGTRIPYAPVIAGVAAVAMTAGSLLALTQTSVRRLLVYSSIAQGGFALAALTSVRGSGLSALLVFLVALALANVCAFAAVIAYARFVHSDAIRDLAGMSRAAPALAIALAVALVSLSGLPPAAGFFGKLLVLQAVVSGGFAWLAVVAAFTIVFSALGYVRVLRIVFLDPPVFEVAPVRLDRGILTAVGLASAGVVFMGLLLGPLLAAAGYGAAALLH
jgi:NADH-quinone oxidoreductase subunit N